MPSAADDAGTADPAGPGGSAGARVLGADQPLHTSLTPHGPRARRRRYLRALAGAVILVAALAAMWLGLGLSGWVVLVGLLALPAAGWLAYDRYRSLEMPCPDGFW